jgi:DNA mismatch endonuclease (patch repair protein)
MSRSENMARIKAVDTRPEQILKALLEEAGVVFQAQGKTPVGRPDLVIQSPPIAIFINGCFWHGCPVHYVRPNSKEEFWAGKLRSNVERDIRQTLALEQAGWQTVRVWEHEVFTAPDRIVQRVLEHIAGMLRAPAEDWRVIQVDVLNKVERLERRHMVELRTPAQRSEDGKRKTTKWRAPVAGGIKAVVQRGTE